MTVKDSGVFCASPRKGKSVPIFEEEWRVCQPSLLLFAERHKAALVGNSYFLWGVFFMCTLQMCLTVSHYEVSSDT